MMIEYGNFSLLANCFLGTYQQKACMIFYLERFSWRAWKAILKTIFYSFYAYKLLLCRYGTCPWRYMRVQLNFNARHMCFISYMPLDYCMFLKRLYESHKLRQLTLSDDQIRMILNFLVQLHGATGFVIYESFEMKNKNRRQSFKSLSPGCINLWTSTSIIPPSYWQ